MPKLGPETVKAMAKELYGYEMPDDAAAAAAKSPVGIAAGSRRLDDAGLSGVQPPFGYPVLLAEARRIGKRG